MRKLLKSAGQKNVLESVSNAWDFYQKVTHPRDRALSYMTKKGIRLDKTLCTKHLNRTVIELARLDNEWAAATNGVNWRSSVQLAQYTYVTLGMPISPVAGTSKAKRAAKQGELPTSAAAIEHLSRNYPEHKDKLGILQRLKKADKERSFFVGLLKTVASDGRVHCNLSASTETGRLSSSCPNLQNQPPATWDVFIPEQGNLLIVRDYAALEWRILAHSLHVRYGDRSLLDDILHKVDPHSASAKRMFKELHDVPLEDINKYHKDKRAIAKAINYGVNYGMTEYRLSVAVGVSVTQAKEMIDSFFVANPGIKRFHEDMIAFARKNGYIASLFGRRRPLPDIASTNKYKRQAAERCAMNVIQNCAADIVDAAMIEAAEQELGTVLQVHDALAFEVPEMEVDEYMQRTADVMENAVYIYRDFTCPLEVSGGSGRTWLEASGK